MFFVITVGPVEELAQRERPNSRVLLRLIKNTLEIRVGFSPQRSCLFPFICLFHFVFAL